VNSSCRDAEWMPTEHAARLREPRIHSHVTDRLPDRHPLARTGVRCDRCESLLHLPTNNCMRTWVETGHGNFCLRCFVHAAGGATPDYRSQLAGVDCLPAGFGLPAGGGTAMSSPSERSRRQRVSAS
jgi:hypothetical protein